MPNEPYSVSDPLDPTYEVPWIQEAHDVIDLGTADSKESFSEWCRKQDLRLQQLRQQLDAHEDITAYSLRYPSAVARQCWHLWRVLGGGDDVPKNLGITADEMDAFLNGVVICETHHPFTPSAYRYIEDVERFLRQAMAWCKASQTPPPEEPKKPALSKGESEVKVKTYLTAHKARASKAKVSIREINQKTGVPISSIQGTTAWRTLQAKLEQKCLSKRPRRRKAQAFTAAMDSVAEDASLNELIAEQASDDEGSPLEKGHRAKVRIQKKF